MRRCCFFFIAFLLAILLFMATAGYEPRAAEQRLPELVSENLEKEPDTGGIPLEPPLSYEEAEKTHKEGETTQNKAP